MVELVLGCDALPEPELNGLAFAAAVKAALASVPVTYDPKTKLMKPWFDLKKLGQLGKSSSSCVVS